MSIFPSFTLPSNANITVTLHEASVSDAMDFSGIDPDCEEEATTAFLNRVQEKEGFVDSRTWTGEDRRYALFMYHLNVTQYGTLPVTYMCPHCNEQHTIDIKLADIAQTYTPMSGDPWRDVLFEARSYMVYPLTGEELEILEKHRYELIFLEDELKRLLESNSDANTIKELETKIREKRVYMSMQRVLFCVDVPVLAPEKSRQDRREQVRDYMKGMPASQFARLIEKVMGALAEMRHGLRSTYKNGRIMLEISGVHCDHNPDMPEVVLEYPFRPIDLIPTL